MPLLVYFAHGKPMFIVHTVHHDRQAGAEETGSKSFRQARSNVETLSQIIPKSDLFPPTLTDPEDTIPPSEITAI